MGAIIPAGAFSSSRHLATPHLSGEETPVSSTWLKLVPVPHENADLLRPTTTPTVSSQSSISTSVLPTDKREIWNRVANTKDTATSLWLASDASVERETAMGTNKHNFFASLDSADTLNGATRERSALLAKMIEEVRVVPVGQKQSLSTDPSTSGSAVPTLSYEHPGATNTFLAKDSTGERPVAVGTWKVIYAPHMTTAMDLFRGRFDVTYDLLKDGTMVSHAYYDFPIVGKGYLSVSGTYGSLADDPTLRYSRVDFDKAWIKAGDDLSSPYESLEDVPDSFLKTVINEIGKRAFIESVAVFPVSFLDDDTIVFEFETLGTKICAHKQASA